METLKIETAQHIDFDYTVAGIGDRLVAALIDFLLFFGVFLAALFVNFIFIRPFVSDQELIINVVSFLLGLAYFGYDFVSEIFMNGQSIGKKVKKIKVVRVDGSPVTVGNYFLRWIFRLVDVGISFGSVGTITIILNGKGQRLGDIAAGTSVVYNREQISLSDTIFTKIPENYTVTFQEAGELTDSELTTIREVLDMQVDDRNTIVQRSIANRLKANLESRLGLKSDMPSQYFLSTLLKDYNFLKGKA